MGCAQSRRLVITVIGILIIGLIICSVLFGLLGRDDLYLWPQAAPSTMQSGDAKTMKPVLRFSEQGSFKILQLTDMHIGEAQETLWGPHQDNMTYRLLQRLIPYENPDLIFLSGDQLTGNDCDSNATAYYEQMGEFIELLGIPWALSFGNHDDADLTRNQSEPIEAKTKRPQLAQAVQRFPLSLTQIGPSNVTGTSNFFLPIYSSSDDLILAQVVSLDSGGGSIPKQLDVSQVEWLREQLQASPIPTGVFQHIPMREFSFDQDKCVGRNGDGGFEPIEHDGGMLDLMKSDGNVMFVTVGHNHGNDYCCPAGESLLHYCFGRHSGYGGYTGVTSRGARVYELNLVERAVTKVEWKTWVRLELGDVIDEYKP